MYHILFIHSSVGGHFDAAMNIGVTLSFQIRAFSGYI